MNTLEISLNYWDILLNMAQLNEILTFNLTSFNATIMEFSFSIFRLLFTVYCDAFHSLHKIVYCFMTLIFACKLFSQNAILC